VLLGRWLFASCVYRFGVVRACVATSLPAA
jgi:hypothetical protein